MGKPRAKLNGNGNGKFARYQIAILIGSALLGGGGIISWIAFARNVATVDQTVEPHVYRVEQDNLKSAVARTEAEVSKVSDRLGDIDKKLAVTDSKLDALQRQLETLLQGAPNRRERP